MCLGKKSAQIREILISESAWEEMTCLFAPSLISSHFYYCTGAGIKHIWCNQNDQNRVAVFAVNATPSQRRRGYYTLLTGFPV